MIEQVRPHQLAQWLDDVRGHGHPVMLDVREPHELAAASVKANGFTLVSIPMGDVPNRLAELDAQVPMAVLCHHGVRSNRVAHFLESQGFTRVANIAGGIDAWTTELDASVPQY